MKPYVGVTGPVNKKEVRQICEEFARANYTMESSHVPMLGFLVSHKTLKGEETKNRRYPLFKDLEEMLIETKGETFNMIHYNSREMSTLASQISRLFSETGIYENGLCRALQMNIVWPDVNQVGKIQDSFPELKIVFQASEMAMKNKTPQEIAQGIKEYGDNLDYILIDPSGGNGMSFELEDFLETYYQIKSTSPGLSLGLAGGFDGTNVFSRVEEIESKIGTNSFSIDAEGRLRDKVSDTYGDDLLNIGKVENYLYFASMVLE